MARSKKIQEEIWSDAVAATLLPNSHPDAGKLLLPALNNMIDMATTAHGAASSPSENRLLALFSLGLLCSLLAGYRMAIGEYGFGSTFCVSVSLR